VVCAAEDLRLQLRDRFDEMVNAKDSVQVECNKLEIEKQELTKKVVQRDERIQELENLNSSINAQTVEKSLAHALEIETLKALIQVCAYVP
jgi:Mg-chelatase subunit ChlI